MEHQHHTLKKLTFNRGYAFALARTGLALATFFTLTLNPVEVLFAGEEGLTYPLHLTAVSRLSIFSLFGNKYLNEARLVASTLMIPVLLGFFPRWSSIVHFWISFSISTSVLLGEGGDAINQLLTLFLIPTCLKDRRFNHWQDAPYSFTSLTKCETPYLFTKWFINVQMSVLYFQACTGKFLVSEWLDGTALFYWLHNPLAGSSPSALSVLEKFGFFGRWLSFFTWSTLILEALLASAIFMNKTLKKALLLLGIGFHLLIGLLQRLEIFSLTMISGLILYLYVFSDTSLEEKIER